MLEAAGDWDLTARADGSVVETVRARDLLKDIADDGFDFIVCDSPTQHDESWTIVDMGMHAKQELRRLDKHPQGPGTQSSLLMAVNRR